MVHAQVDGRHLVARGPARALPLHDPGQALAQPVVGDEEGPPVLEGGVEVRVVGAAGPQLTETRPHLGRDAVHDRRTRAQSLVDVGGAQHAEGGPELGHRGPVTRHVGILPRADGTPGHAPVARRGRGQSLNRGVSWSSSGPTAASAATCSSVLS